MTDTVPLDMVSGRPAIGVAIGGASLSAFGHEIGVTGEPASCLLKSALGESLLPNCERRLSIRFAAPTAHSDLRALLA